MNKTRRAFIGLMLLIGAGGLVITTATPPPALKPAAVTIQAAGRGNPWINFADGREIPASYSGSGAAESAIDSSGAHGLALASADFDEDGMPDLVASFDSPTGGLISLHFGNVDAVYPNAPEAKKRRAEGKFVNAPFLPDAKVFETLERPDFIGAGDFDADGHWDVVAASTGGKTLTLHRGDGAGGLLPPESLPLPGAVTALATGDVNRRDGLEDVLVGVATPTGALLLVFEWPEGALRGKPEEIALPEPATGFAVGWMDDIPSIDIAVAAGKQLVVLPGRDRRLSWPEDRRAQAGPAVTITYPLPFTIVSLVMGDFDVDGQSELAVLADDGGLRLAGLKELAAFATDPPNPIDRLEHASIRGSTLIAARVSSLAGEDIVVRNNMMGSLTIVSIPRSGASGPPGSPQRARFDSVSTISSVLPMRLNTDALSDLVCLSGGDATFTRLETFPLSPFTVTNTNDTGPGSLRAAILGSNGTPGPHSINFSIFGPGPHTIRPLTGLPAITEAVSMDGSTQPGFSGLPLIEISGELIPDVAGLDIHAPATLLRGFIINRFRIAGGSVKEAVLLSPGSDGSRLEGLILNLDSTGTSYAGGEVAVRTESNGITLGGTTSAAKNLIYGNEFPETIFPNLWIRSSGVVIQGNYIGLNVSGTDCPSGGSAAAVYGLENSNNTLGGTTAGARNVISCGMGWVGSNLNLVQGNYFGTDASSTSGLPTPSDAIAVFGTMNTVGGTSPLSRNIISGRGCSVMVGEHFGASNIVIQGNYIGTDSSGALELVGTVGIQLQEPSDTAVVERILIGGSVPAAGNLIAGQRGPGSGPGGIIIIEASDVTIQGNNIGTDITGSRAMSNHIGVRITDAARITILDNLVAGSLDDGVSLEGPNTNTITIQGNRIGTDTTGTLPVGNAGDGISISAASSNLIGGSIAGQDNIIRFNGGAGIAVNSSPLGAGGGTNEIRRNSISDNGGLGIELNGDGVTPNDPGDMDLGGNEGQNYPVLSLATTTGSEVRLVGTLESKPGVTYSLQFFASPACDPSGHGEGMTYLGTTNVVTNGSGVASFEQVFSQSVASGQAITAVAISPGGDTSEFSACQSAFGVPPGSILGLRFPLPSGADIVWDAVPGALFYHFYVGTISTLSGLATPVADSCEAAVIDTPGGTLPPASNPPPGQMFWFLATAEGLYGEGPVQPSSQKPREFNSAGGCGSSCVHSDCDVGAPLAPACTPCASIVCEKDPTCCSGSWSANCVQNVRTVCRSLHCASSTGQCPHSLCETGQPLPAGCDAPPLPASCTAAVCQALPHCCQQAWDESCLDMMSRTCGYNCI